MLKVIINKDIFLSIEYTLNYLFDIIGFSGLIGDMGIPGLPGFPGSAGRPGLKGACGPNVKKILKLNF